MKQRTGSNFSNHLLFHPTQQNVSCYPDPYRRLPFPHVSPIDWAPVVRQLRINALERHRNSSDALFLVSRSALGNRRSPANLLFLAVGQDCRPQYRKYSVSYSI